MGFAIKKLSHHKGAMPCAPTHQFCIWDDLFFGVPYFGIPYFGVTCFTSSAFCILLIPTPYSPLPTSRYPICETFGKGGN
jgi:hypothetical protein